LPGYDTAGTEGRLFGQGESRFADFLLEQKQLRGSTSPKRGYVDSSFYIEAERRLGKFPYDRGHEMKIDLSERGRSLDDALGPFIKRLKKADTE
jgi:hypothetical protein